MTGEGHLGVISWEFTPFLQVVKSCDSPGSAVLGVDREDTRENAPPRECRLGSRPGRTLGEWANSSWILREGSLG